MPNSTLASPAPDNGTAPKNTILANDGLLKAGNFFAGFLMGALLILGALITLAIPIILLSQSHFEDIMAADATASLGTLMAAITGLLAILAFAMLLGAYFLQLLRRIIKSVGNGDPFIPENADRLARMGWMIIILTVLQYPVYILLTFISIQIGDEHISFDIELVPTGLLLALVLFILARIFRHGTVMRDDLEGTV